MKLKARASTFLLLLFWSFSYAQLDQYTYKRELKGIKDTWHKVILPEEIFGKVSADVSDIRVFGINTANDTMEASYILQLKTEKIEDKEVNFKISNTSHNEKGYYFTLEVPTEETLNQLYLNFNTSNFDWRLNLEGSQNQQEWFTVVEDYRIISIKNPETDYQFTKVTFPDTKYRFFRLLIKSKEDPKFSAAKAVFHESINGSFHNYHVAKLEIIPEKKEQLTILEVNLKSAAAVSSVQIMVKDTFDFYRPISIQYVSDSIKTEQGWKYRYQTLKTGTLSSVENNEFKFESTILKKLKISISNHDNEALTVENVIVKGYVHELMVRFTENATYFLTYGNERATKPNYDIERFVSKIPETLTVLNLAEEQTIEKKDVLKKEPLFKNKMWLWLVMGFIILVLGWYSVKMMKKK